MYLSIHSSACPHPTIKSLFIRTFTGCYSSIIFLLSFLPSFLPLFLPVVFSSFLDSFIYSFTLYFFLFNLTIRFHVAVYLFKDKKVARQGQPSESLMFLLHIDIFCDLLLNWPTATWNLFVIHNKEGKNFKWWHHLCICPSVDHK